MLDLPQMPNFPLLGADAAAAEMDQTDAEAAASPGIEVEDDH